MLNSASGLLSCSFTAQLPSPDQGYVIAQAKRLNGAPPLTSAQVGFAINTAAPNVPGQSPGRCALVNDTFDPLSYQKLGPPKIMSGKKPPRAGEAPEQICTTTSYVYTAAWTASSAAACGIFVIANTAAVDPIGAQQPTQATTTYVEINACNSAQQALPPPAPAPAVSLSLIPILRCRRIERVIARGLPSQPTTNKSRTQSTILVIKR